MCRALGLLIFIEQLQQLCSVGAHCQPLCLRDKEGDDGGLPFWDYLPRPDAASHRNGLFGIERSIFAIV